MAGRSFWPSLLQISLIAAISLPTAAGRDRPECASYITNILNNSNSSSITAHPELYVDLSDHNNPILTLLGCEKICGSGYGIYHDIGPKLVTWLLPVILLVANMQFAPIGKESALMILHLLGDPNHSTFSLIAKVEDWRQCLCRAEELGSTSANEKKEKKKRDRIIKSRAVIAAVAKELNEHFNTENLLEALSKMGPHIDERACGTASALADSRDNEMFRTCFAIVLYIFQVIAAFVPAVGEASSPSGGRIGPAMLLSWLLPVVLLSNVVGDLGSRRNCMRILVDFLKDVDKRV
jgi:hypothetical protein